jgi:hypothetical protein
MACVCLVVIGSFVRLVVIGCSWFVVVEKSKQEDEQNVRESERECERECEREAATHLREWKKH